MLFIVLSRAQCVDPDPGTHTSSYWFIYCAVNFCSNL